MIFTQTNVLILSPHTDDGELGCGGTIARLVEGGATAHYVAFSICETSVPPPFPSDILEIEVQHATKTLDIPHSNLTVLHYPVRKFSQHRQDILETLVQLNNQIKPDLVFIPSADDVHQDHQVIYYEGVRAFKKSSLLGYELPWNNLHTNTNLYVNLDKRHLERKFQALQCYKSQRHRTYTRSEFIESLALIRGEQIGTNYAESFQIIRWIIS